MKRWPALLLVMLLVLSVAGCSGSKEPAGAGETAGETEDPEDGGDDGSSDPTGETGDDTSGEGKGVLVEGDFIAFSGILDVIDKFKELSYTAEDIVNGQVVSSSTVEYVFLGDEPVDGQNTRHVKFGEGDQQVELWFLIMKRRPSKR